jgi:hypothetical protein
MSPTGFRYKGYRFFFFSREEKQIHIHIHCADGEAKFWLEPTVSLADNYGLSTKQLRENQELIEEHKDDIIRAGTSILEVEVLNISIHGIWLYVNGKEYFLSYENYPWFKNAKIAEIHNAQLLHSSLLARFGNKFARTSRKISFSL